MRLQEEMKKVQLESESNPEGPLSEYDAGQVVLGKTFGYVRGIGRRVFTQPKETLLQTAQANRIKMLESELNGMNEKLKEQDDKMAKQEDKMAIQDAKMAELFKVLEQLQHHDSLGAASHNPDDDEEDDEEYYWLRRAHIIVVAEKVVLNFMQRMRGIATLTKKMADAANPAVILETRRTAPGLR